MAIIRILLVVAIVCAAIFVITFVAHRREEEDTGKECEDCNGDCLHCGRMPDNKKK